jgi:site-specific recombinase XerC
MIADIIIGEIPRPGQGVAAWVKDLQQTHGAPGVKQQLAAVRMLFDWLITGQIVPMNPAVAVRGPKHVVKTGKTPVLEHAQEMAAHESPRTTKLYDRTRERLTQDEVERIRL